MRKEYCMHYLIRLTDNTIVAVIMLSCPQFNKAEILLDFFKICFLVFFVLVFCCCFFFGGGWGGYGVISYCFGCVLFSFFFFNQTFPQLSASTQATIASETVGGRWLSNLTKEMQPFCDGTTGINQLLVNLSMDCQVATPQKVSLFLDFTVLLTTQGHLWMMPYKELQLLQTVTKGEFLLLFFVLSKH